MVFEDLSYKILPTGVLNYVQAGACVYSIEAVIWACIFSITALILRLIANHLYKTASIPNPIDVEENEPLVNEIDPMDIAVNEDEKEILRPKQSNLPESDITKIRTARGCIYVSKWLIAIAVCSIAIIPSLMSSVDIIPIALSIVINLILLSLVLFTFIHFISRHQENPQNPHISASLFDKISTKVSYSYQQYPATLSIILVVGILYSICIPLMTAKACFALYSPDGTFILGPFHVSTAFTRLFAMSQVCPLGKICHIYATLPEDASTSIILNVHTGIDVESLVASYDTLANFQQNRPLQFNKQGMSLKLDIETQGARYVHSIYLDSLSPNTDYYVNFVNNGTVLGNANFSTFPTSDSEANIVMVGGGDSSGNDVGKYFTNKIAEYDPDVIFVGGDIVYDNAGYHCYYCWDVYLKQFEQLNQKVGRLVPLILAIGNHDIGFTHNWFLSYDPYQTYFYLYFPQHTQSVNQVLTIPPPEDRSSYFYHRIGNILLVSLDTGYAAESGGQQLTWLQNVVSQNSDLRKFAHYHVAILSACQYNPQKYGPDDRMTTWVPLFEDNRFMTVFENHYHLFKRTFPLKLTTDEGPGVVYAGDGGWGINPDDCFDTDPDKNITGIFQRLEKLNHVWIINSGPDKVDYKAINLTGGVFDSYSQNIVDYA